MYFGQKVQLGGSALCVSQIEFDTDIYVTVLVHVLNDGCRGGDKLEVVVLVVVMVVVIVLVMVVVVVLVVVVLSMVLLVLVLMWSMLLRGNAILLRLNAKGEIKKNILSRARIKVRSP